QMRRPRHVLLTILMLLPLPAWAQEASSSIENVRTEYAEVLRAEPVYETLRATSMTERCEASTPVQRDEEPKSGFSRMIGAVRGVLPTDPKVEEVARTSDEVCRLVPLMCNFRRRVSRVVDHEQKSFKYQSRLPYDHGNRQRVLSSNTPIVVGET